MRAIMDLTIPATPLNDAHHGGFFMGHQKYSKQALSLDQQIKFLLNQGLVIDDDEHAKQVLSTVSYYRLSGYLLPFKEMHNHHLPRQFKLNTSFDHIWQLYQFDQELRLLVIDAIEKIEVAFRTSVANITSIKINPFWYTDQKYYRQLAPYYILKDNIEQIIKNKHEIFIKHYYTHYSEPPYPPIWMMIETLSFGFCSKMFKNIKQISIREEICSIFNRHPTVIESWIQALTYVRNLCAHHARLWNRWFVQIPIIPKNEKREVSLKKNDRKFIIIAYILQQLLKEVAPKSPWRKKLFNLFEKYENFINFSAMGFITNWRDDPFWTL